MVSTTVWPGDTPFILWNEVNCITAHVADFSWFLEWAVLDYCYVLSFIYPNYLSTVVKPFLKMSPQDRWLHASGDWTRPWLAHSVSALKLTWTFTKQWSLIQDFLLLCYMLFELPLFSTHMVTFIIINNFFLGGRKFMVWDCRGLQWVVLFWKMYIVTNFIVDSLWRVINEIQFLLLYRA